MGILQNFNAGSMSRLRSVSYEETGTKAPYVTKDVKNPPQHNEISLQVGKRVDDVSRIAQMLIDRPGLTYLGKEALLKASEGGETSTVNGAIGYVARVAASTLAQVPVNGTGTHFVKGFNRDFYIVEGAPLALAGKPIITGPAKSDLLVQKNSFDNKELHPDIDVSQEELIESDDALQNYSKESTYTGKDTTSNLRNLKDSSKVFADNNGNDNFTPTVESKLKEKPSDLSVEPIFKEDNRELAKAGKPINGNVLIPGIFTGVPLSVPTIRPTTLQSGSIGVINKNVNGTVGSQDIAIDKFNVSKVKTKAKLSTEENISIVNEKIPEGTRSPKLTLKGNNDLSEISGSLKTNTSGSYTGNTSTLESGKQIQDFRLVQEKPYSFDYSNEKIKKETRVGLGDPGRRTDRSSYIIDDSSTLDKINNLDVSVNESLNGITENRDLIQLEFQIITPDNSYYLAFRAFLDTFDDSFNAQWDSTKYLGRADNFYTYGGFERSINIGFKIAAQSRQEMRPLYRKAATLASVTAPTYGQGGKFMRGSVAKVTVGDYIYEQPGIIESVQYTWQKDYPWEIAFQGPEGGDRSQILPHLLDVSVSFKPIHDFLPQTGIAPFISNHRPINGNKDTYVELNDGNFTGVQQ